MREQRLSDVNFLHDQFPANRLMRAGRFLRNGSISDILSMCRLK